MTTLGPGDGRGQRSERSREAIVSAMLELVGEGRLRPTAEQVAERAGVGIRTVFRHFSDTEGLFRAMHERLLQEAGPLLAGGAKDGPQARRARALVERRAKLYEHLAPYLRAGRLIEWRSRVVRTQRQEMVRELRRNLLEWLPELAETAPARREAVEMVTSFEAWERLRSQQELPARRARAAVERALTALLAEEGAAP